MRKSMKVIMIITLVFICFIVCGSGQRPSPDTISVVSREDGSGTRGAFVELFEIGKKNEKGEIVDETYRRAEVTNSTSVMITTIAGNKNAIGYISLGVINDSIKPVKIDGVEISSENIKNKSYKVARPFNIVTKENVSDVTKDFINFIMSEEGQKVVTDEKCISIKSIDYTSSMPSGEITISGSSSVAPIMEALKEEYMKINKNAVIKMQQNDSTTGINSVIEGISDIGMVSRELKESELNSGIICKTIAMDGIAVIVNKGNSVDNLSSKQVKDIFMGNISAWREIENE